MAGLISVGSGRYQTTRSPSCAVTDVRGVSRLSAPTPKNARIHEPHFYAGVEPGLKGRLPFRWQQSPKRLSVGIELDEADRREIESNLRATQLRLRRSDTTPCSEMSVAINNTRDRRQMIFRWRDPGNQESA